MKESANPGFDLGDSLKLFMIIPHHLLELAADCVLEFFCLGVLVASGEPRFKSFEINLAEVDSAVGSFACSLGDSQDPRRAVVDSVLSIMEFSGAPHPLRG